MDFFTSWLILVFVNAAATISPGPAFALTVHNAMAYDRRTGLMTALGLGTGVGVLAFSALFGFAALIAKSILLFNLIKYAGAAYLIFLGIKALRAKKREAAFEKFDIVPAEKMPSSWAAFRTGLITNLLNVKGMIFFSSIFIQFITPGMSMPVIFLYGFTAIFIEITWFSIVTFVLTDSRVKRRFLSFSHWIERICGGLLIALGIRLAISKS